MSQPRSRPTPRETAAAHRAAQEELDRIRLLRSQLETLQNDGIVTLTPDQRARLEQHFDRRTAELSARFTVDPTETTKRISWGMRVGLLLGSAALSAALILFLHRVWSFLPSPVQAGLLAGLPCLVLGGAAFSRRRRADPFLTDILALASAAAFVAGLSVLTFTLNLALPPHALAAWGIFAGLVGLSFGSRLLFGAALLLLVACPGALWLDGRGWYWGDLPHRHPLLLLPTAGLVYLAPRLAAGQGPFDWRILCHLCGGGAALFALLLQSFAGHLCCTRLAPGTAAGVAQLAGIALAVGMTGHGLRLCYSGLVNLGSLGFVIFLYARIHAWCWDWLPKYLFFTLLGLTALAMVLVFRQIRKRLMGKEAA